MMKIAALLICIVLAVQALGQTPAQSLEGSWHGTLEAGQKLRLVLTVSKSPDGAYSGKMDSLDQGATIPIEVIKVDGDSVRLEMKTVEAVFEGKLNADSSELTGQFSQGGANLALTFKRGAATSAEASKPSTPQRPIDVPVEVVVPAPPTTFNGGGKTHLGYELHITNFSRTACLLTRVEILRNDSQKKVLAVYQGDQLGNLVNRPGVAATTTDDKLKLGPGLRLILDLDNGRFAFYAHLQPASMRVKLGNKVRRGQVLGLVGNSGNSTEPHLHFHISNGNSPLGSEGVPHAFPAFEVQGKGWGWKAGSANSATEKRQNEMPLDLEVVRFSSGR